MLLLEQNNTKREWVEKIPELNASNDNNKKYKVEAIQKSDIYAYKSKSGHLPSFYYLVACKGYLEEENTQEPLSAV